MPAPDADLPPHVRSARPADAEAIGAVQARAWRAGYAHLLPPAALATLDPGPLATTWRTAITRPPSPAHTVLVAVGAGLVVGVVACDDRGELTALEVDPAGRRAGHGSRLLAAVADHARTHGLAALAVWCPVPDEPRRALLTGAGFAPDGGLRVLGHEEHQVQEAHLVASLAAAA